MDSESGGNLALIVNHGENVKEIMNKMDLEVIEEEEGK